MFCQQPVALHRQTAEEFIRSIFSLYESGGKGMPLNSQYLHHSLLTLIHEDLAEAKRTKGIPDALDVDMICDTQNWDHIRIGTLQATKKSSAQTVVTTVFDLYETNETSATSTRRTIKYILTNIENQWLIVDIGYATDGKTFRQRLLEDIAYFKKQPSASYKTQ